jgi:DNA modification methylase
MPLIRADARFLPLPDRYVQCCVTSPPYWGLRDYKTAPLVWGGEAGCNHTWGDEATRHSSGGLKSTTIGSGKGQSTSTGSLFVASQGCWCQSCGAWRGSLGLEPTPDLYVSHLVEVFREVRRVLRDDGTLWLNLGDSYAANRSYQVRDNKHIEVGNNMAASVPIGLKPKDLIGIPWRVAFALQADGWYLRSEVIWAKAHEFCPGGVGSTMPESVRDRPTRAHETVFLLTKQAKYFYDAEAVKQQGVYPAGTRAAKGSGTREGNRRGSSPKQDGTGNRRTAGFNARYFDPPDDGYAVYTGKRNLRDVWFISPTPYKGAHFATFPPKLVEPCLLAGSASWDSDPRRSVVLDPFCGSGTVGLVARQQRRCFLGIDLNPDYLALAQQRRD